MDMKDIRAAIDNTRMNEEILTLDCTALQTFDRVRYYLTLEGHIWDGNIPLNSTPKSPTGLNWNLRRYLHFKSGPDSWTWGSYSLPQFSSKESRYLVINEPFNSAEPDFYPKKCTCGSEKSGIPGHSSWCDRS